MAFVRLRAAGTVAAGSLRLYWTGALLAVILGAIGFSVQVPVRSLGQSAHPTEPRVALTPVPIADAGISGTPSSLEPGVVQGHAVQQLFELLLILGWGALIIVGISMLTRFAAQAAGRGPEIGVRRAAGASRRDLVLSLLGEGAALLLAVLAIGVPASLLVLKLSAVAWPGSTSGIGLLPGSAVLMLAVVIVVGVLAPLRYAGSRHMRNQADGQVLLGVPAFQLAMSLMVLMGSTALLRNAPTLPSVSDPAGEGRSLLMAAESRENVPEARSRSIATLLDTVAHLPGISGVSLASPGTLLGLGRVDDVTTDCGACVRGQIYLRYDLHTATHYLVSPDTFVQQNIRLVSGRGFADTDRWGTQPVAVVSRHLEVSGFEARGAVGRDLYLGNDWPNHPVRVIGVVEDTRRAGLGGALEPLDTIYLSVLQHPPGRAELLVRGGAAGIGDSAVATMVESGAGTSWRVRPGGSPGEILASAVLPVRWFARWFAAAGLVVFLGALAGTFGTMRMWVESCIDEIASRRAVGATRIRILGWVLWHTAGVGFKGVLAGVFLYFAVLRVSLTNLVGPIPAWDPAVFSGLAALLVGAAVLGALVPAAGLNRRPIASLWS